MEGTVYTPGAGHRPPVLAGRETLLRDWELVLNNIVSVGRVGARDFLLLGVRGVGKTALLGAFAEAAEKQGFEVISLQGAKGRRGLVEDLLEWAQGRVRDGSGPWQKVKDLFENIGGVNFGAAGLSAGVTIRSTSAGRSISPGTLAEVLAALADVVSQERHAGAVLTVDEMQAVDPVDLALLAAALHRLNVDHPKAAVAFAGAGLPNTSKVLDTAGVTHATRLFRMTELPLQLDREEALFAIIEPARRHGVSWNPAAADQVVSAANSYPPHLQLFAARAWEQAAGPSSITQNDVDKAIPIAVQELVETVLMPRWRGLSDRQMEFLAALALLGGSSSMGRIAALLQTSVSGIAWIREQLLKDGDIYSPRRGIVALTVPVFADFVLKNYEEARNVADIKLATLFQMTQRLTE
jgi:hypothetical protein